MAKIGLGHELATPTSFVPSYVLREVRLTHIIRIFLPLSFLKHTTTSLSINCDVLMKKKLYFYLFFSE